MNNCQLPVRYNDCRNIEKRVQEEVIDVLNDILGTEAIISNLTEHIIKSERGNIVKRPVMSIFLG